MPSALPAPLRPALLCALWLLASPASALKDDENQPLLIEADAAELDDQQSLSLYLGNVDVRQGSMHILADEVLVQHRPDRQIERIIAVGRPVRYRQMLDGDPEPVHGEALRAEYDTGRAELTLIDQAVLTQGTDRFASDRIIYNRTTARVTAGGSAAGRERVRIRLTPEGEQKPGPAPAPVPAAAPEARVQHVMPVEQSAAASPSPAPTATEPAPAAATAGAAPGAGPVAPAARPGESAIPPLPATTPNGAAARAARPAAPSGPSFPNSPFLDQPYLEEGIVKSGSFSIDQGVGVRAVSGEKTAFAYSDDIGAALLEAARTVRAPSPRHRRRAAACKVALPAGRRCTPHRPDRHAWTARRRWREYDVVLVARADGTLAADVRPLVRLS
jgi:lipopolysaccharide export system protein LptA